MGVRLKGSGFKVLRWLSKILHDPKYHKRWEYWYYSILRSCRIFSINSSIEERERSQAVGKKRRSEIDASALRV